MYKTLALCAAVIATAGALWLWLDRIQAERDAAAVTTTASELSAPPRIVPAEIPEVELRRVTEPSARTPESTWIDGAPQTVSLGPGERRAITVSVAGEVRLHLRSAVPVNVAFGTVHGEMFADFDSAVRSGECFAGAVTEATKECKVTSGATLLIEDARPASAMVPQAVAAMHSGNPAAIIAATKPSEIVFTLSTR